MSDYVTFKAKGAKVAVEWDGTTHYVLPIEKPLDTTPGEKWLEIANDVSTTIDLKAVDLPGPGLEVIADSAGDLKDQMREIGEVVDEANKRLKAMNDARFEREESAIKLLGTWLNDRVG